MNPSHTYKQTTINFSREPARQTPLSSQVPPEDPIDMESTASIEWTPLPQVLMRSIQELARKYAAIACKSINLGKKLTNLAQHKTNGTIPEHLKFKFNKVYTAETDVAARTALIVATIDGEIEQIRAKVTELNNQFINRINDMKATLASAINQSNLVLSEEQVVYTFNNLICEYKFQFIIKQEKDERKKEEKKQRFLQLQEEQNEIATLSNRQVNAFKKEITSLKNQLKTLTIQQSKNQTVPKSKKRKRSTGTLKKRNGKK
jgi:hypothetical protein